MRGKRKKRNGNRFIWGTIGIVRLETPSGNSPNSCPDYFSCCHRGVYRTPCQACMYLSQHAVNGGYLAQPSATQLRSISLWIRGT